MLSNPPLAALCDLDTSKTCRALSFKPEIISTEPTLSFITTPTLPPFSILSSLSRDFLGLRNISRVFRDPFSTSAHAVTIELLGVGRPTSAYLVVESRSSRVQPVKRAVLPWRSQKSDSRSRDVVDQTLSGGEPSPSDVPASTNDKQPAEGDAGETNHITTTSTAQTTSDQQNETRDTLGPSADTLGDKDAGSFSMDSPKQSAGLVASRALELNGLTSASDGGDETASLGGSESDASRTDGRHHTRTGSVKKPTSFKPVSFAKFSVPKAPGTAAPPKAPEKGISLLAGFHFGYISDMQKSVPSIPTTPMGTPQPTARPRLVPKSTSAMRDSLSKTGPGGAKLGGSGPDPNQVWNKNRPVQPVPPKHLTDEELKQQYGIHMTSRIQEDGVGGSEAKWADIDDDEDDWAPETIEWTDGTKVTLGQHNEPQPLPEAHEPESREALITEPTAVRDISKIAAPKPTTSVGPNPTVLRLGANAERQAKAASISSKGTNDRTASGSTSPAPPSKSPWATLPPVERVSPVNHPGNVPSTRPPVHHPQPHRDDARYASLPPQEIATDDFNRTWRETAPNAPRELYNSRSGRYEPVADNRRPSYRQDQGPRAPNVLQRPGHEAHGPAEPSAAFQTQRTSHDGGIGWNRHRAGSNVSGGSGGFDRRMSFGRADGPPRYEGRRGSQVNGLVDPALMGGHAHPHAHGHAHESPSLQHATPSWGPQPPAHVDEVQPVEQQPAPAAASEVPQEDPLVVQERIMKEKRLEARQRRLQQEEKEKAERDERIRQKLAALGPAPDKQRKNSIESRKAQTPTAPPPATISSPPKPPVPEPTGAPKQYGMMKVHHPDSVKRLVAAHERDRAAEKPHTEKTSPRTRRAPSPNRDAKHEQVPPDNLSQQTDASPQQGSKTDEHGAQWRGNLNVSGSTYSPWSTNPNMASTSPSVKNPWKPLISDRTLGNGIFDQSLGGFTSREVPLRGQLGLDQSIMPPQALSGPPEATSVSPLPSPDTRNASFGPLNPIGRPGPIGPPSSQASQWQPESRTPGGLGAWNSFHKITAQREHEEAEKYRKEFNVNREARAAGPPVTLKETWSQVRPESDAGQRRVVKVSKAVVNKNASPSNPLTGLDAPPDGLPGFSDTHARPLVSMPARSSRFFPHVTEQAKRPVEKVEYQQRSPSPPPPEEIFSHPVYFGGEGRPLVHLPNPKPVVKLPPKALAAQAAQVAPAAPAVPPTFASMAAAAPRAPVPASTAMSWQEKINGLFGKKTPVEKKSALAVASATKEPLDVQLPAAAVPVSFPSTELAYPSGDGDLAVRQVDEQDDIFEDREPGSLPGVRVPMMAPPAAWLAAPAPSQSRLRAKNLKTMQIHSVEPFWIGFGDKDHAGNIQASIRLPGSLLWKTITLPKKAGAASAISKPQQRTTPNFKARKGSKPREVTAATVPKEAAKKSSASQQGSAPSSSPRHNQSRAASWGPRQGSR
ncbi:uncharacterized protein N7443_006902 [Penicillium atrosanguineum]|uniref:uncharacterized protein n=1 Tax=Penicillium atrosanguineum TaxID=1132637 RepID=UPI0023A3F69B|nr:uncharacterized protein N7443_006902 [Penicillium atrosanguineum]KAJ5298782.1 hypothetical protein N7443_006902 [Penicillium atrosanguineum]